MVVILQQSCPRFSSCSAPVCPLDSQWRDRKHCHGEPVCYWFREAVKGSDIPSAVMALGGDISLSLASQLDLKVSEVLPEVISRWGDIKAKLKRAATQSSKSAAFA